MAPPVSRPEVSVLPIHFEDRSGSEFERLCLAYLIRAFEWKSIDWSGQLGGDRGRDIWAVRMDGETECFQCANHARLAFRKVERDLGKLAVDPRGLPARFTLITGGKVSASMKAKIVKYAMMIGLADAEVWSGPEFEERLRRDEPLLVRRFAEGVPFPESVGALRAMSLEGEMGDSAILALMAECFDRPAFTTPFMQESSVPDFKKAITDTIEALNTGVRRLRDGTEIGRIPRRSQLKDPYARATLARVVDLLVELRAQYDSFTASGELRPCGCGRPDCSIFMIDHRAASVMDDLRRRVLAEFARVAPDLGHRSADQHGW
jgi:hypothetical protein